MIPPDTLIQVSDSAGSWHAAAIGSGLLCRTVADEVSVTTTVWRFGLDRLNCPRCRAAVRRLEVAA